MNGLLVFGKTGQVANALARLAPGARFLSRADCDLTHPQNAVDLILRLAPKAIINATAFTNVDQAEADTEAANMVNGTAPAMMASQAATMGIPFIHISTDYVFSGEGRHSWTEDDRPCPVNSYGKSKLLGENRVATAGGRWLILRTSWVFSPIGHNFVKAVLRRGKLGEPFSVVTDQVGGPTAAKDIAQACLKMLKTPLLFPGIYHFSGQDDVSRADFAREILRQAGMPDLVRPITSDAYPAAALRPKNSRLDCTKIGNDFGLSRPDWRQSLSQILNEVL